MTQTRCLFDVLAILFPKNGRAGGNGNVYPGGGESMSGHQVTIDTIPYSQLCAKWHKSVRFDYKRICATAGLWENTKPLYLFIY